MLIEYPVTLVNKGYTKLYPEGTLLDEILKKEGVGIPFVCNGLGSCGKCRVKVSGKIQAPTLQEQRHLSSTDLDSGIRLACQLRLTGPIQIEIPEESSAKNIIQFGRFTIDQFDPLWGSAVISDGGAVTWEKIGRSLPVAVEPKPRVLQELTFLKPAEPEFIVEFFGGKVLSISAPERQPLKYGVAVDIGTTTLAAYLVNLKSGAITGTASTYNPQSVYGADLISRIQFAGEPENLIKLHELIIGAINQLILDLITKAGITENDIIQVNCAGNTCMLHLLLKVNPAALGKVPFEPVFKSLVRMQPSEIGLHINPDGFVYVLPGIGGFVGSDISAGIIACQLAPERNELFLDIGTNGEIVITGRGRMLACSTAAGPAFEGATISCGMLAKDGAIIDLGLSNENITLKTIGDQAPKGICGTGLIRALVELLQAGFIDETGRWAESLKHANYDPETKRFYLVKGAEDPIYISQADIRQFQLAKSAIRTGIELLLKRLEVTPDKLGHIYLAGAFGTYLKPEDAIYLGILPEIPVDRIDAVGNSAGMGTVISILSQSELGKMVSTVTGVEHVELAEEPGFTDFYTESMLFKREG